ncbi:MAG: hypothetical protein K2X49_11775 [Acetobacteraceae bacterium]|nr:hypothetical protein [Acetobacteraceae bacterium]
MTALDFAALDGLAFAAERGRLAGREVGPAVVRDLGPLVEMSHLAAAGLLPKPGEAPWLDLADFGDLRRALTRGQSRWVCPSRRNVGFLRTTEARDEKEWNAFGFAAQQAAVAAGFAKRVAAQLVGAVGEMYSNIHDHSGAARTGLLAFAARGGSFEFVVADRGVGVLDSLRTCPDYAGLDDHGEALRLALSDGVSRCGAGTGHGKGFRPLFIGVANLNGLLRFRSGDHALIIDGHNPSLVGARLAQKPRIGGFLASVKCLLAADAAPSGAGFGAAIAS